MKNKLLFFALIITVMVAPQQVMAWSDNYDFSTTVSSGQTLYFKYTAGGRVLVTYPRQGSSGFYEYYTKPTGDLIIPDTVEYNGVKWNVVGITAYAFHECTGLTSVVIGDNIPSIEIFTFFNCTGLTSITIGENVSSIGQNAFYGCLSINSITCMRNLIPTLDGDAFYGISSNATLNVPCGTADNYSDTGWGLFSNIVEMTTPFTATVNTSNDIMGSVSINQCGNTITATANEGYHFVQWNDGDTENPRVLNLTTDAAFTAQFAPNQYEIIGSALSNGTVSGGNTVDYLDSVILTAIPNEGYYFTKWSTWNGSNYEDYSTDNPLTVQVTGPMTYYANFEQISCTVEASPLNSLMGYTTGGGTVYYGSTIQLQAYANTGYRFVGWSDGVILPSRNIYVTSNIQLTALFEAIPQYVISVGSNNSTMGTVNGGGTYYEGDTITLAANPSLGYRFVNWNDGVVSNPRAEFVVKDSFYMANFEIINYVVTAQTANSLRGSVEGTDTVYYGETVTLTATANEHFIFQYWQSTNGATHGNNPLTVTVTSNDTYTAYFVAEQHSVALYSDGGGTVYIGNSGNIGNYDYFSQLTLTATANGNNAFLRWSDGNSFNPRTVTITQDTAFTALFLNGTTFLHDTIIDTVYFNHYTHDTTYIYNYVHDTVRLTTYVIDTTIINFHQYDTTINNYNNFQYDTTINNYYLYDTVVVNNYQHDTTLRYVYDTVYLLRYLTDTVFIHDTIFTTEGIGNVEVLNAKVYTNRSQIFVEGADGNTVTLFDLNGRILAIKQDYYSRLVFDVPASGTYLIKVGNHPARKVVVIR